MNEDKTNPKYARNPAGHLQALMAFRNRLDILILGEDDTEWRAELQFVRDRTMTKIREVQTRVL